MSQTILVVDDVATERTHLRKLLEPQGFTVIEAEDGDLAVSQAVLYNPSLILMDVVMPTSGFAGTRLLKKNKQTASIPVIMVTSKNREPDRENAAENGAVAYIVKPATHDTLMAAITKVFAKQKLAA